MSRFCRRIGFVAFTWSSRGEFVELVPWTEIGSAADAQGVAERLRAARMVSPFGRRRPAADRSGGPWRRNLRTDISAALGHALRVLAAAPFHAERSLINLCANGEDNVEEGPDRARQRAAAAGVTVNGVVLGKDGRLASYLREHVRTGAGSFVIEARDLRDLADAMLRKFLIEIAWLRES